VDVPARVDVFLRVHSASVGQFDLVHPHEVADHAGRHAVSGGTEAGAPEL
jgi:hypothetical protein